MENSSYNYAIDNRPTATANLSSQNYEISYDDVVGFYTEDSNHIPIPMQRPKCDNFI